MKISFRKPTSSILSAIGIVSAFAFSSTVNAEFIETTYIPACVHTSNPTCDGNFPSGNTTLHALEGDNVALLVTNPSSFDEVILQELLDIYDNAYEAYTLVTGRIPDKRKVHQTADGQELSVIALINSGFCGFACGQLHGTGIETSQQNFINYMYNPYKNDNIVDVVPIYELGRNFWYFSDQLNGDIEGTPGVEELGFATGYAIFMRWYILHKLDLEHQLGSDQNQTVDDVRELFTSYLSDSSLNWGNTVLVGASPVTTFNPNGDKKHDFTASMFFYMHSQLGDQFIDNFWRRIKTFPLTTDNDVLAQYIFEASSDAVGRNLSAEFSAWKLPLPLFAGSYTPKGSANIANAFPSGNYSWIGWENTNSYATTFDYSVVVWTGNAFPASGDGIDYFWENNDSTAITITKTRSANSGQFVFGGFSEEEICNRLFVNGVTGGEQQIMAKVNVAGNANDKNYHVFDNPRLQCPERSTSNVNILHHSYYSGWSYSTWLPVEGASNYAISLRGRNIQTGATRVFTYYSAGGTDRGDFLYAYEHEVGICRAFRSGTYDLQQLSIMPTNNSSMAETINISGRVNCQ